MTETEHTAPASDHDDSSTAPKAAAPAATADEAGASQLPHAETEPSADWWRAKRSTPSPSAPAPSAAPRSDWWSELYDADVAWEDTNSGTPRGRQYAPVSGGKSVVEASSEEGETAEGEEGPSRPVGSSRTRVAKDEDAGEETLDDPDPDGPGTDDADPQEEAEPAARRNWRPSWAWTGEPYRGTATGAIHNSRGLAARRRMGLGYVPAVAAYFSLHLSQHVQPFLTGAVTAPSGMVGSFLALTAMPLVWKLSKGLSTMPYGAVIRGVATLGSGTFLYGPGGEIATAYLSAQGIDPSYWVPFGSGLATAGLSWWLIDRRINHLPWPIACALRIPTTTIALSLGQFVLPT